MSLCPHLVGGPCATEKGTDGWSTGIWGQSPVLASQPAWLGQMGLTSGAGMAGKELAFGTYEVTH